MFYNNKNLPNKKIMEISRKNYKLIGMLNVWLFTVKQGKNGFKNLIQIVFFCFKKGKDLSVTQYYY